jgi:Do/DeqQ family serine protease
MQRFSDGFAQVASSALPAVVSIRVEATRNDPSDGMGFPGFPFPFGGGGGGRGRGESIVRGTGSGVIVRPDGVIVTNNHVVEDAQRVDVHLRDGRVLRARILGTDPSTDLAVIKVDAQNLTIARWGDSENARVGEWVLAIGAPFGLEATVTHGVLSAKGRAGLGANPIEDYLQTDASINPGNSGGPLINLRGEVLGINTMIVGRGSGIGFAVPSRIARAVAEQIVAQGHVTRGWIGVGVQDLSSALADSLRLPPDSGALVSQIDAQGPSARAGLRPGDVITHFNGQAIQRSHDVVREVTSRRPGEQLNLTVMRGGRSFPVTVTTAARPDDENPRNARAHAAATESPNGAAATPGIEVNPLTPAQSRMMGVARGVVVTHVDPGSPADRAGLRRGDVILRADDQDVGSSGDLVQATQDGRAALLVRRRDQQIFVPLQMQ